MINENRPFERPGSKREHRQKIQLKNFAKQFRDRKPIKKFTDFMGENLEQSSNKEKIIKHINSLRKKINEFYAKLSQEDLDNLKLCIETLNSNPESLPEEELVDIHRKIKNIHDRYTN